MENPKHLRLWDCAACTEDSDELTVFPPPLNNVKQPSGLVPLPAGAQQFGGASVDFSALDRMNNHMKTPAASGVTTPAIGEAPIRSMYHYQSITSQDRGRYDRAVHLRLQRQSAYGDLDHMEPLTVEQLRTPGIYRNEASPSPQYARTSPSRARRDSLYQDAPSSGPEMLVEAAQTLATEVIQTLSPRKTRASSPPRNTFSKPSSSSSSSYGGILNLLPSSISSFLGAEDEEPQHHNDDRVEVTKALQQPALATTTRKRPVTYGGAYATSPYHIQRPNHVEINDFPSPSRTPFVPAATRRTRD